MDYYPTLLELTGLSQPPGQPTDGISLIPALEGKALHRDAIFTYFPHSPGVPDWMPASVSVHHGHWKLIRIFHGGDDGEHRWKLFHLDDDLGEQHDLADRHPDLVKSLDHLIEKYLRESGGLVPKANPNFDPAQYDLAREGIQIAKKKRKVPAIQNQKISGKAVAGWKPIRNCELSLRDQVLRVKCVGPDPHLMVEFDAPLPPGEYRLTIEMSSDRDGKGQWFWSDVSSRPKFIRDRSTTSTIKGDRQFNEYVSRFKTTRPLQSIRWIRSPSGKLKSGRSN